MEDQVLEPALRDGPLVGSGRAWWSASHLVPPPRRRTGLQRRVSFCESPGPGFWGCPEPRESVQETPRRQVVDRATRLWAAPASERWFPPFFLPAGASRSSWLTPPRPSGGTPKTPLQLLSKSPGRRKCGECGRGPLSPVSSAAAASSARPLGPQIRVLALVSPSGPTALVFTGGSERAPPTAISPIGGSCQSLSSAGMISGRSCWPSRC